MDEGEMCSTLVSVNDGEDLTALQEKAFSNFKSTCRKLKSSSVRDDASPCYGPFTFSSYTLGKRYPQAGDFNPPLERLEFSVRSTENVFLDFYDDSNKCIIVELGRTSRIDYGVSSIHNIDITTTVRFWVTFTNNMIKVGRYEDEAPFMEADIPNKDIKYILFFSYGQSTEWQIYMPCVSVQ